LLPVLRFDQPVEASVRAQLGEDVTETLEVMPRQWKVIQTMCEKFFCRECETITQPPAAVPRDAPGLCSGSISHKQTTAPEPRTWLQSHPNQITTWKAQLENGAADIFSPNGIVTAQPAIDVKSLHVKIGELTLENDS
jgi:hypothetical protein